MKKESGVVPSKQDYSALLKKQTNFAPKNQSSDENKQLQSDQKEVAQKLARQEPQSQPQQSSQSSQFNPTINNMQGMQNLGGANQSYGVSLEQAMLTNFLMNNNQMKMPNPYQNTQQPNMMGFNQMPNKNLSMQGMMQQQQQTDLLSLLTGVNPMAGLAGLAGMQGLNTPLSNGMMPQNNPPPPAPKTGFTSINPPPQPAATAQQQPVNNQQQSTLLLLQQLAMYRDILAQLAYPGQMNGLGLLNGLQGLSNPLSSNIQAPSLQQLQQLSGLAQGMGQQMPQPNNSMPNLGGMGGMNMQYPGYNFYGAGQGMSTNNQPQSESP